MAEKKPVGRPRKYGKGQHPNSKKGLKSYPKGVSGNPAGSKPKPKPTPKLDEILNKVGNERSAIVVEVGGEKTRVSMSKYERLIRTLFKDAFNGKPTAQNELTDRVWGKSPDTMNLNIHDRPEYKGKETPEKYIEKILNPNKDKVTA